MARCRMLDVPGHEPRSFAARRAVRFHLEPQLRGAAGAGWPHPPYVAGDGRCGGNIWCNRGCERAGVKQFIEHRGIAAPLRLTRSEEHTSELQSLMRISYAVFCLKKKKEITK